jgi:hypothetical protein
VNLDANVVIGVLQEKINELISENLILKAQVRQLENAAKEDVEK